MFLHSPTLLTQRTKQELGSFVKRGGEATGREDLRKLALNHAKSS